MHAINIGGGAGASVETPMVPAPTTLSIRRPDDWHVHLRDGPMLAACAVHTARQFARGIIMPNLVPPVTKVAEAAAYRDRIRRAVPAELKFEPLMTCYLTDGADPAELARGKRRGRVGRRQALSRARHDQLGARRHLDGRDRPRPGGDGEGRHAAAGPWRGDRSRGRHLRPRGGVPRQGAGAADQAPSGPEGRARAHHDARGRAVRRGPSRPAGRHHHAASSQLQPQRDLQGRHPSALLLPADRQARGASSRPAQGGDLGQPRNSSSAPTPRRTPPTPRNAPAAAPACSTRRWRCRSMPRSSWRRTRSTGSRPSPR